MDAKEPRRAAILEVNPDGTGMRVFASGLRNPDGMDWEPGREDAVDGGQRARRARRRPGARLPDQRPGRGRSTAGRTPTSGRTRIRGSKGERPDLVAKAVVPDVPLGAHTASLGLAFYDGRRFPGAVPRRRVRRPARLVEPLAVRRLQGGVRAVQGRPAAGQPEDFLTGFIADEAKSRSTADRSGVAVVPDGSLLVADDGGNVVWRVTYIGRHDGVALDMTSAAGG